MAKMTRQEGVDWLRGVLEQGPRRQKEILALAKAGGLGNKAIFRAKTALRVESYRSGFGAVGGWYWRLPQASGAGAAEGPAKGDQSKDTPLAKGDPPKETASAKDDQPKDTTSAKGDQPKAPTPMDTFGTPPSGEAVEPAPEGQEAPAEDAASFVPSPPASAASQVDRELVKRAYQKYMANEELSAAERAALKRYEREKEERQQWRHYTSIPQKHWRQMSGRQTKVLQEQAERYDLPFGGATVNLPELVRKLHNFLAANALKLSREDDLLMQGAPSPALEDFRRERATMARLDRLERENQLIPRDQARQVLGRMAMIQRSGGEGFGKQYGPAALAMFNEILDDLAQEVDRFFGPLEPIISPPEPPMANGEANADADGTTPAAE
jgi:hypothetical protein